MLCNIILWYILLPYVMLCYAMLCYVTLLFIHRIIVQICIKHIMSCSNPIIIIHHHHPDLRTTYLKITSNKDKISDDTDTL